MARNINTLSLYPSDELILSLKDFKESGNYKSLSAAAITILSLYFTSTVQSTLSNESSSTVQSAVQNTVLEGLVKEVKNLTLRIETLEQHNTLVTTVQSTLSHELSSTVQSTLVSNVLEQQTTLPDSVQIDEEIEVASKVAIAETLPIEKLLTDETLSKAIAETKTKPTYRFAPDGSIILRSLKGISQRTIKRYSDAQLHEIGLYREQIGISTKYWEIQEDRREGKPKEPKTIATDEPKENLADKRFTAMAATAYYRVTTGQPLKETTLIANSKKYGFKIKEKGSGLYALINP